MADTKGDVVAYPKVVTSLPFQDSDNSFFYNDDYVVRCAGDYNDTGGGKVWSGPPPLHNWPAVPEYPAINALLRIYHVVGQMKSSLK